MVIAARPTKVVPDIDEVNRVNALTERVKRRKDEYLAATPHLAADRSRLATQSWKETEGEPLHVRRAKLFKKVLEGIPVSIWKGEVIVGSESQYVRGASPVVDFDPGHTFDMFKSDQITLSGVAKAGTVTEAEKQSLLEDARYWSGKSPADAMRRIQREVFGEVMDDFKEARINIRPEKEPVGTRQVDYEKVINRGLSAVIAEAQEEMGRLSFSVQGEIEKYHFLNAVIISCQAVIGFARRYAALARRLAELESDPARKKELLHIADTCERVPGSPARDFREALQSLWFVHVCLHLETSWTYETPGRMDQYLYPLYRRDLEEGRLTRQEAAELLGCLWVKFAELEVAKGDMAKQAAQANTAQDLTIGGVTSDGKDATNELTYLILEVTRQLKTVQPSLYLRCHRAMPAELWKKAVEVVRDRGDGMPAFLNDESALLNLVGQHHIPLQEARDWAATGCGTTQANHASPWDTFIGLNTAKIFELTLSNGVDPRTGKRLGIATGDPKTFSSLEELYNAFKRQFEYFVDVSAKSLRLYWLVRNQSYSLPFTSALTDDCISRGMDHAAGGARYPQLQKGLCDKGHQNVADSMAAIKKLVFEEKKISMPDLLEAMSANFEGREAMRQMLLSAPKYGNDDDYVDEIFGQVSLWTQRRMVEEMNVLGTNTSTGRGGVTQHLYYGKTVGALPDGRKAWEPLADGSLSPMRGMDVNGPTAVIKSATKVNHTEVGRNSLFNMKISASSMQGEEGLQKLIALIKTHFNRGGHHIQFNLMGQDILLEAKKHPEQHKDLLVRVAGYSAYFVDLSPEVQDDIIARVEQCF